MLGGTQYAGIVGNSRQLAIKSNRCCVLLDFIIGHAVDPVQAPAWQRIIDAGSRSVVS
jgi:hypothetical protein